MKLLTLYLKILFILFTLLSTGCASYLKEVEQRREKSKAEISIVHYMKAGHYQKVIKSFNLAYKDEMYIRNGIYRSRAIYWRSALLVMCEASLKAKDYKSFFHYTKILEKVINNKDFDLDLTYRSDLYQGDDGPNIFFGKNFFKYTVIKAKIDYWYAQAFYELGDYKKSLYYASQSYDQAEAFNDKNDPITKDSYKLGHANNSYSILATKENLIDSLGLIAILTAVNDKERSRNSLEELRALGEPWAKENTYGAVFTKYLVAEKNLNLAKGYLALAEYSKAYKTINNEDESKLLLEHHAPGEAVGPAMMNFIYSLHGDDLDNIIYDYAKRTKLELLYISNRSLLAMKRYKEAKQGYDLMLRNKYILGYGGINYNTFYDRGKISFIENNPNEATLYFKQAVQIIEQQRSSLHNDANKIGFIGDKQDIYSSLIEALIKQNKYGEAFEYIERSKSRALVDLLASKKDFSTAKSNANQHVKNIAHYEQSYSYESDIEQRKKTRSVYKESLSTLKKTNPTLHSLISVQASSAISLQNLLSPDETILEFFYHKDNLVGLSISKYNIVAKKLDATDLDNNIKSFREILVNSDSSKYKVFSKKLYKQLINPFKGDIKTTSLSIVPHGILHYLPFSALLDGRQFLNDKYTIRVLPSVSVLQFIKQKNKTNNATLIFGNPDLNNPKMDLPYAQIEAQKLAKVTNNSHLLVRKQATETVFKNTAGQYERIHLATHGIFDANDPLSSGLLLAKDASNDGTLMVSDLYDLSLNADLVTLSACETGIGEINKGDDVIGMNRGFLYAGARSILSSLWQVDDKATAILMLDFYENLKTMNKAKALREAMHKLKQKYPNPYYWAAFQLTGAVN